MMARTVRIPRIGRRRNRAICTPDQKPDVHAPLKDLLSCIPWHAAFGLLIPTQLAVLQLHCHDSSPFHTHPPNMWTFLLSTIIYCFTLAYYTKSQLNLTHHAGNVTYLKLMICAEMGAVVSGSLAYTALMSVLVQRSLQPIIFTIYFVFLFIYFAGNLVLRMAKKLAKTNIWKSCTGTNDYGASAVP